MSEPLPEEYFADDWDGDGEELSDEDADEEECGRWDQNARGGLQPVYFCRLAGTEFCDFICPLREERTSAHERR